MPSKKIERVVYNVLIRYAYEINIFDLKHDGFESKKIADALPSVS